MPGSAVDSALIAALNWASMALFLGALVMYGGGVPREEGIAATVWECDDKIGGGSVHDVTALWALSPRQACGL